MGIPRFFKVPQHKQFNYEPLYYDERKERLQERIKQIEQEYGINNGEENIRSLSKGSFSYYYDRKRKTQKYSNTRLVIIILFLLFVAYFLFFV
jgi:hypothetical protein